MTPTEFKKWLLENKMGIEVVDDPDADFRIDIVGVVKKIKLLTDEVKVLSRSYEAALRRIEVLEHERKT